MRVLQLTDLHIFCEPGKTLHNIPTRESMLDVVEHLRGQQFDHVIVTGDHTHDEMPASYRAVRDALAPWMSCLAQVPGNHDDRAILREVFADRVSGTAHEPVRFSIDHDGWLLVGLDTHLPGEVSGVFDEEQGNWLEEVLSQSQCHSIAVFLHHPPCDVGSPWMDAIGLSGRDELQSVLTEDGRAKLICCGHVHHEFQLQLAGIPVYTTPSTGIQFHPDSDSPRFDEVAPGYRIIELHDDGFQTEVVRLPEVKYVPVRDSL
ncbi:MAG TPA: hypothetical protein DCG12_18330 [Planctomycetaceae bacterium]|nr:hypothetical protein [Planctomycetaceae bacterium]